MRVLVAILRRDVTDLDPAEKAAIEKVFQGLELEYKRLDPKDYLEHDRLCVEHKPDVVILPKDRPIPSLAMEHGVVHVAAIGGELRKLASLVPTFLPYNPPTA